MKMRSHIHVLSIAALLAVSTLLLTGCGDDGGTNTDIAPTRVRLLHFGYDVQALDLRVNSQVVATNVTYGNSSGYKDITPGQDTVSVHYAGNPLQRASSIQTVNEGNDYTVYAFPPAAAFSASMHSDPRQIPPGRARIKFVNACDDASDNPADDIGYVSVRITDAPSVLLGPEGPTGVTSYTELASGKYAFTLQRPASPSWVLDLDTVSLASSGVYTMIIHGTLNESDAYPLRVRLYVDNGPGTDFIDMVQAPAAGKILFAHAVLNGPPINIAVDGAPAVTSLSYGNASMYTALSAGSHTATASVASNGSPVFNNVPFSIENRKAYTVIASGSLLPPDIAPIILPDVTSAPPFNTALVRFVHAAPATPDVDVKATLTSGTEVPLPDMQGIAYRATSESATSPLSFVPVSPTGTFTLRIMKAGTQEELMSQTDIVLLSGKIYTIWLGGSDQNSTLKAYMIMHN